MEENKKREKLLSNLINKGYMDQQITFTLIQELLNIDSEAMLKKLQCLRQRFIDEYREQGNIKGWY